MAKLDEGSLEGIANAALQNATTYSDGVIAEERAEAWEYFNGELFGNEVPGRSQVVTRDVFETVMWTMPSLMRIFMGGDDIVKFEPRKPGDEPFAEQATEYCNYVVRQQNQGFELLYTQFMDALLQKNGVVQVHWDKRIIPQKEKYEGLSAEQVAALELDGWEVVKAESRPDPSLPPDMEAELMLAAEAGLPVPMVYDVTVKRDHDKSQVRIEGVPPEEILVMRGTKSINEDDGGIFRRRRVAASDLIAEGYKREDIESLPADDSEGGFSPEAAARYDHDDYPDTDVGDFAARKIWVTDCYLRVDMDDDGVTELRKITIAGGSRGNGKILVHPDEGKAPEIGMIPFASVCPVPLPHRYYGLSLADITMDLQKIHSTLFRQSLDSLYLANNPRFFINGRVNLDDMLTSRPGGIVRGEDANAIVTPLSTPFVGAASFPMIELLDRKRQARTGVSKFGVGVDGERLNNETATGAIQNAEAANERVELIARIFAETGISRMFLLILHAASKHSVKKTMLKLRDEYVEVDPREWEDRFDLSVRVGLGTGNKDRTVMQLQMLGQLMALLRSDPETRPMVPPDRIYNFIEDVVENAGLKRVERYAMDPRTIQQPPQQQQPNPEAMKAQAEMQMKQAEMQFKQQQAQAEMQAKAQQAQMDAQMQSQIAERDAQLKMQIAQQSAAATAEIERFKAQLSAEVEREKAQAQIAADRERMMMQAAVDRERMTQEFQLKRQELGIEALLEEKKMEAGSLDGNANLRQPE